MQHLSTTLAVLATALSSPAHKPYVLTHPKREHCRAHYVKRVERVHKYHRLVKETFCVYVAPKPSAKIIIPPAKATPTTPNTPTAVRLRAHLDPSFTQNPANPLIVTYSYSASAEQEGVKLATANLPSGVLAFYSEGLLICSMNVGAGVSGGECTIDYSSYGSHQVNVIYSSGESSTTTGTESVTIAPPVVTLSLGVGVRSHTNPFAITYTVGASAEGTLPNGTLTLKAGEGICSMTVGSTASGGNCPIEYATLGGHEISLTYQALGFHVQTNALEQLEPFTTTTTENIAPEGPLEPETGGPGCKLRVPGDEVEQVAECEYTINLLTVDQYGTSLTTPSTIELKGVALDGKTFSVVLTPPSKATSCTIDIEVERWLKEDATAARSNLTSPNCAGELHTGVSCRPKYEFCYTSGPGNDIASWSVTSTYIGTPGWLPSQSEPQTVWSYAELG